MTSLTLSPVTLKAARAFVGRHHRHHRPPQGGLFAVGISDDESLVGVAIVGRPVSRHLDNGWTAEVTRLCTLGHKNACSMLYAAAWRACRALGYQRLITYILASESGASVRAAGWREVGRTSGGGWDRKDRPRTDKHDIGPKTLFEAKA